MTKPGSGRYKIVSMILLAHASVAVSATELTMQQHMEILRPEIERDITLEDLPSIVLEPFQTVVPLDDRLNADDAFAASFLPSLDEALPWYLGRRGLRVTREGADLRLVGVIEHYAGDRGWGEWGVDVRMMVRIYEDDEPRASTLLRVNLLYSDPADVQQQEKGRYAARGKIGSFRQILFTRVGFDLAEKLIVFLKERSQTPAGPARTGEHGERIPRGRGQITIECSVPNAEVHVDGDLIGTAPLDRLLLPAGRHSIEIRKAGYQPWVRDLVMLEGAASRIVAELEPAGDEKR